MAKIPTRQKKSAAFRQARLLATLEQVYDRYHHAALIDPDPLAPVMRYPNPADQEIVGLVAASLAFGNVKQIMKSIESVLAIFPEPAADLQRMAPAAIARRLQGFRHRYVGDAEMTALLLGARQALRRHGSLGACFQAGLKTGAETILPALSTFVQALGAGSSLSRNYLLPDPGRGSACKRWCMYLRWMVRRDQIDPGCWEGISPAMLIVPMDTHLHRISLGLGLTRRKQADLRTALEVTAAFRQVCPEDPVRYDFSLTRMGIRPEGDVPRFLAHWAQEP